MRKKLVVLLLVGVIFRKRQVGIPKCLAVNNMNIGSRIEDALFLYKNGRYEGAFLTALVAVAATARRDDPDQKMGDRESFEAFLDKRRRGVLRVEFRGDVHTIPHIFYKWFRCELVHEGGLPIDVQFIDTDEMSVRAGGAPEYILKISTVWFKWLINSVVTAPCNASEFAEKLPTSKSSGRLSAAADAHVMSR